MLPDLRSFNSVNLGVYVKFPVRFINMAKIRLIGLLTMFENSSFLPLLTMSGGVLVWRDAFISQPVGVFPPQLQCTHKM